MVTRTEFESLLDKSFEWLAVYESGRTLPFRRDELEVGGSDDRPRLGFVTDVGFRERRVTSVEQNDEELVIGLAGEFGKDGETVRLVARESAAGLRANIEIARLRKANEIAECIARGFVGITVRRIELSKYNGRLAQIYLDDDAKRPQVAIADVTGQMTHENLLASAILLLDRVSIRKKLPISEVWIAGEKRQARKLQRLHALLNSGAKNSIKVIELSPDNESAPATFLRSFAMSDLWRRKPAKLVLPVEVAPSETADAIIRPAPDKIDVIYSRQGETLRFNGLPFARVRTVLGDERSWYGVGRDRRPLIDEERDRYGDLLDSLHRFRQAESENKRHELYRLAPEAWLESLLRRNIKLLDPNLILAPIFNQFRTSTDKIDLLAIRRDGRLVIIELKASPDRDTVYQAADYWQKIELQRRRGVLAEAKLFGELPIADEPTLVYIAAPALSFHHDFERFARTLSPEIELWRWELHEDWRKEIKVIARRRY